MSGPSESARPVEGEVEAEAGAGGGGTPPQGPRDMAIGALGDAQPDRGSSSESGHPEVPLTVPRLVGGGGRRARRTVKADASGRRQFRAQERVLLLDAWMRSRLPASEFAGLVGVSPHTLYQWKQRFEEAGPAGLSDGR